MAEHREHFFTCESCGKAICAGDLYQPGGDCNFCEEHAATLADVVEFWEWDLNQPPEHATWADEFDSLEAAQEHVEALRERVKRDGADFKPLQRA